MKTLKLDHTLAATVLAGQKTSIWRLFDDKNFSVNDTVAIIDKVDPHEKNTWQVIGEVSINKIVEKRLRDIDESDYDGHERYSSLQEMIETFQKYYSDELVTPDTPVKILYFSLKPYKQLVQPLIHRPEQIDNDGKKTTNIVKLYADGGSRGNPGPSASGYALLSEHDEIIIQRGVYLGVTTNNQAEYQALRLGLEAALKLSAHTVEVYMDSMLVVNQMKGIFKVKNRDLWPIHDTCRQLLPKFRHVSFTHVPRELNKLADSEVNKALDDHLAQQGALTTE